MFYYYMIYSSIMYSVLPYEIEQIALDRTELSWSRFWTQSEGLKPPEEKTESGPSPRIWIATDV